MKHELFALNKIDKFISCRNYKGYGLVFLTFFQFMSLLRVYLVFQHFHCFQVHDIAFAPNVGRSYFILGVATNKDLRIISIKNTEDGTKSDQSSKYTVRLLFPSIPVFSHFSENRRVEGNSNFEIAISSHLYSLMFYF